MQPLSYQIGRSTCWGTSVINGIMYLRWKYLPEEKARIESFQHKLLNSALGSVLRSYGVPYNECSGRLNIEDVMDELDHVFSLRSRHVRGAKVATEIRRLNFDKQVAICDVGNGDHSVLLNAKSKRSKWLYAFDPWWYNHSRKDNANVTFPKNRIDVNVRIRLTHLLDCPYEEEPYSKGIAYSMGEIETRFLMIIECKT